jgi:hypothetical protein
MIRLRSYGIGLCTLCCIGTNVSEVPDFFRNAGKSKSIPVTGLEGPYGCRDSHIFLENQLTDCGEVVSLTHRQAVLYPQEDSWYTFLLEARVDPRAIVRLEVLD